MKILDGGEELGRVQEGSIHQGAHRSPMANRSAELQLDGVGLAVAGRDDHIALRLLYVGRRCCGSVFSVHDVEGAG